MISEATKTILASTVKEWNKFKTEQIKLSLVRNEGAAIAGKVILEQLQFLKTQSIDVQCDSVESMKVLGVPIIVQPVIEAVFPNTKGKRSFEMCRCCANDRHSTRTSVFLPAGTRSRCEQLQRMVPESFAANAAEFVRDAFLNVARTGEKKIPQRRSQRKPAMSTLLHPKHFTLNQARTKLMAILRF